MSDNTKQIILKTVTVMALVFLLLWCLVCPIVTIVLLNIDSISETTVELVTEILGYGSMVGFFCFGVLMIVLMFAFGGFKQKPAKAEKFELKASDFQELSAFLNKAFTTKGFKKQGFKKWDEDKCVSLYLKQGKYSYGVYNLHAYALVRVPELTDELLDTVNDRITDIMNEYYNGERITDVVRMPTIVCVDRITPTFQKMVNSNIEQGIKNIRLPVGISFGGRKVYVAKQEGGFAIAQYRKLRK